MPTRFYPISFLPDSGMQKEMFFKTLVS